MRKAKFEKRDASQVLESLQSQIDHPSQEPVHHHSYAQADKGFQSPYGISIDLEKEPEAYRTLIQVTCLDARGEQTLTCEVPRWVAKKIDEHRTFSSIDQFSSYIESVTDQCVWDRLLVAIKGRERSCAELSKRLQQEGFDSIRVTAAIQRACACQLVDDTRYAAVFIRSKIRAGWGRQRIERELRSNGIEPRTLKGYPQDFFVDTDEYDRALEQLSHKRIPQKNPQEKLARFLVGRGFDMHTSLKAAQSYVLANQTDKDI